ncbi:hypothetical protein [Pelagibaculum spongiae]|uniref:Uncharacterized protein n=1 Tax=Pelagibaculum spongiae TaxID=2080658 RepID=A0A2V1GWJ0_9GAMM|nr:hypothetical protein [Pelagibaculum spongiae]PVZ69694.1 hypothetical protein DC094_10360 [Pelagibaculum spongiae]
MNEDLEKLKPLYQHNIPYRIDFGRFKVATDNTLSADITIEVDMDVAENADLYSETPKLLKQMGFSNAGYASFGVKGNSYQLDISKLTTLVKPCDGRTIRVDFEEGLPQKAAKVALTPAALAIDVAASPVYVVFGLVLVTIMAGK